MAGASNFVSVSRRAPDIEDYIDMMRRHRSLIIAPMFAGLVISVVAAFMWDDTFVSTAVMQITPQQISQRLVPTDPTTEMQEDLNEMQQEILSRGSLAELIQRPSLNLYPKQRTYRSIEDIISDMRNKAISIQIIDVSGAGGGGGNGNKLSSAFAISFRYSDKYKAQQVVRELVSKFVEENINAQSQRARVTTQFMDDELKGAKKTLDDMNLRLTKWKIEHQGQLPEQFQSNEAGFQGAQMEAQRLTDALSHAQTQKVMLQQNLENAIADKSFYTSHAEDTLTGPGQLSVRSQQLVNLDAELLKYKAMLASMKKQYGENYPAMNEVKAQIETLEAQKTELDQEEAAKDAAAASGAASAPKNLNPQVQQRIVDVNNQINTIKTQIAATQQETEAIVRAQGENNKRIAGYQARLESAPLGAQEYEGLLRDFNLAQQAYDIQVKKKEESDTQQNLQEHRAGAQLVPLDPPSLPDQPVEPKRAVWAAVGTGMGLMIGVLLAAAKEMKDTSLKNLKDIRAYTNLPVLSSIPLLENTLLVRRKRRLYWLAWSASFIIGSLAMTASMYYHFFGKS